MTPPPAAGLGPRRAARIQRPAILVLFFLSGAAGLVYQVVWSRLLNDVFGVSAYAVTAVLAAFLGGLALGSWALGRLADRVRSPLRLYGWLEIGIACTALAGTLAVRSFRPLDAWFANRLAPDSAWLLLVRMLLASAVILPPTLLMGGTLPAVTRAAVDRIDRLGRELSLLYGLNTAGAVSGSLLAGFVLIRALGVHPTLWLGAAANLLAGAAALGIAGVAGPGEGRRPAADPPAAQPEPGPTPRHWENPWLLAAMALSGVASLSLEVLWTRVLVLVVGTSSYAFVTMLSTFLVGIALGSFLARAAMPRLGDPRRAFGWTQLGIAASTLATVPLSAALVASAQEWVEGTELRWGAFLASRFGVSFLTMIVPTTLVGMTLPLAGRIWARRMGALGGQLGQLYGANTLGNILGALLGGFAILPAVGMQRGILLVAMLNLACAGWGLLPEAGRRRALLRRAAPVWGGLSLCALLAVLWQPRPFGTPEEGESDPMLFYREGLVSTVKVIRRADDGRQALMFVDGVRIGQSSTGVDRKQQVLAHFPFLLGPGGPPRKVLTIGLGTGILTGEVARHPGVERVDVVELEPAVIEAARAFEDWNDRALANPRVRVINDDGVGFLRRSPERYDAVISDGKSRSGHAGNALFYSLDYYRSAREHLTPGGLMIQWVPLDLPGEDLRIIVRTFLRAFRFAFVWLGPDSCFLAGTEEPLVLDRQRIDRELAGPATLGLQRHGWRTAEDVAALLIADGESLRPMLDQGDAVNSLEHPVLEFYALGAVREAEAERVAGNLEAILATRRGPLRTVALTGFDGALAAGDAARAVGLLASLRRREGDPAAAVRILGEELARTRGGGSLRQWVGLAIFDVARHLDLAGRLADAAAVYRLALQAWPDLVEARVNLGRMLAGQGRAREAQAELDLALRANPESGSAHRNLAKLLLAGGDPAGAIPHLRAALRLAPAEADAHDDLGLALSATGEIGPALSEFLEAVRLKPAWPLPMGRAALLLALNPDPGARDVEKAIRLSRRAVELSRSPDASLLDVLAASYAAAGDFDDAVAVEEAAARLAESSGDGEEEASARAALALFREHRGLPT
ncbi:MAG TPA: fused MFS/spermidine synthase, partial [Anaeromyxobacteraceae bacterium]|nr:fused MFS/spermidine synthase [Anaeromyxobacteraceae bacterium]